LLTKGAQQIWNKHEIKQKSFSAKNGKAFYQGK